MSTVTIWSDYVCPWCYVGLTELERAREGFELAVDWQPFLLRPETPDEGLALPEHIKESLKNPNNPLTLRAKSLGLVLNHRQVIPPTRKAHAATEVAKRSGKHAAFHRSVLHRYWTLGENINEWSSLRGAAEDAGLDPDVVEREAKSPAIIEHVEKELAHARSVGISAVPTFVFDERYMVQGAQEAATFRKVFEELKVPKLRG